MKGKKRSKTDKKKIKKKTPDEVIGKAFPDKRIPMMTDYKLEKYANHTFITPNNGAKLTSYSFNEKYLENKKFMNESTGLSNGIAGDFLILMRRLHDVLDPLRPTYTYGICDPRDLDTLQECANILLRFVKEYGLFGLYQELKICSDMTSLDINGNPLLGEDVHIVLNGSIRFKQFLNDIDFEGFGLSEDFYDLLDRGVISIDDYGKIFMPWTKGEFFSPDFEFLEDYSESVAIILNSDVFISGYYQTVLGNLATRGCHEDFTGENLNNTYISKFNEINAENLVLGHYMLKDYSPTEDFFQQLDPHIASRLQMSLQADEESFLSYYDIHAFYSDLNYQSISYHEFEALCNMIEPVDRGKSFQLPNNYQVSHYSKYNGETNKWEMVFEAVSLIGMILNRRITSLVYNDIEIKACANSRCNRTLSVFSNSSKIYCDVSCAGAQRISRFRAKNKRISTPPRKEEHLE